MKTLRQIWKNVTLIDDYGRCANFLKVLCPAIAIWLFHLAGLMPWEPQSIIIHTIQAKMPESRLDKGYPDDLVR